MMQDISVLKKGLLLHYRHFVCDCYILADNHVENKENKYNHLA